MEQNIQPMKTCKDASPIAIYTREDLTISFGVSLENENL